MEKLKKFIEENGLKFDGRGSALNGDCVVIAGFADHCGITNASEIIEAIQASKKGRAVSATVTLEVNRVFDFAYTYNYGNWWKSGEARSTYTF